VPIAGIEGRRVSPGPARRLLRERSCTMLTIQPSIMVAERNESLVAALDDLPSATVVAACCAARLILVAFPQASGGLEQDELDLSARLIAGHFDARAS
jgi:hypothetical protein